MRIYTLNLQNPMVRKDTNIVLFLSCKLENRGDFRFCNFCGEKSHWFKHQSLVHPRMLGSVASLDSPEDQIDTRINNILSSHLENTSLSEERKLPVMKYFKEFMHSLLVCNSNISNAMPNDVIRFLAYNDISGTKRTVAHDPCCFNIGNPFIK